MAQRIAIVSSPRSANTWLRRLLVEYLGLEERSAHTPWEVEWEQLPERCVLQLHWPRTEEFVGLLDRHGFQVCVLMRHPLDLLISILHFCVYEPETARWLDGSYGDERALIGTEPCSRAFVEYARSPRARALLSVSPQWWNRQSLARIHFERFVRKPEPVLTAIAARSGIDPVISPAEALDTVPFARMKREAGNHHFWQGEVGLWRRLLPPAYAKPVAEPHRRQAWRHGYRLTPDRHLTLEAARLEWQSRIAREGVTV